MLRIPLNAAERSCFRVIPTTPYSYRVVFCSFRLRTRHFLERSGVMIYGPASGALSPAAIFKTPEYRFVGRGDRGICGKDARMLQQGSETTSTNKDRSNNAGPTGSPCKVNKH